MIEQGNYDLTLIRSASGLKLPVTHVTCEGYRLHRVKVKRQAGQMDPKRIANETLTAFQKGSYTSPEGMNIELLPLLQECLKGTRHFQPEELRCAGVANGTATITWCANNILRHA